MNERIVWHYTLPNGKKRTKSGEYYGQIKHTVRYIGPQLALVRFDGNKRSSKVPFEELVEEKKDES